MLHSSHVAIFKTSLNLIASDWVACFFKCTYKLFCLYNDLTIKIVWVVDQNHVTNEINHLAFPILASKYLPSFICAWWMIPYHQVLEKFLFIWCCCYVWTTKSPINLFIFIVEKDGAIFHHQYSFESSFIFYCKFFSTKKFNKILTKIVHKMHFSKAPKMGDEWRQLF